MRGAHHSPAAVQPRTGILDEGAHAQVGADLARLPVGGELAVAVVDRDDDVGVLQPPSARCKKPLAHKQGQLTTEITRHTSFS
jgi:hypothetical protein